MGTSNQLSYREFLEQFRYVNLVVLSCKNELQLENAKRWAEDWAWRMKNLAPKWVSSATDLYLSVIER